MPRGLFLRRTQYKQAIERCGGHVRFLHSKIAPLRKKKDSKSKTAEFIERLKWPFNKEDCQQALQKLHRFVQTFEFSLVVSNW